MGIMNTREERAARTIGEQAAEWLLRLEEGREEDRADFSEWIKRSPVHIEAFLRAAAMDTLLTRIDPQRTIPTEHYPQLRDEPDLQADSMLSPRPSLGQHVAKRSHFWRWAVAASTTGLLVTSPLWHPSIHDVTTDIGEQRTMELQDGSVLHLNATSEVAIEFDRQERRIKLLHGEALFRVHGNSSRPFRVYSGKTVIEALGTQFDVEERQGDALVAVLEGAVQVSNANQKLASPVHIAAGEQLHIARDGTSATKTAADLKRISAWQQRRLVFKDDSLSRIAEEFNRYNRSPKIRVEDAQVGKRRYAAAFDADDPESLIVILERDPTLSIERRTAELVVRSRAANP